jgi:hypothetical protein
VADGFRITESGDLRVTEDSVSRISERYHVGEGSLVATGSQSSTLNVTAQVSASLANVGSVLYAGNVTVQVSVNLQSSSTSSADVSLRSKGVVDFDGVSTQVARGLRTAPLEASLSSTGSSTQEATRVQYLSFSGSASGTFVNQDIKLRNSAVYEAQQDNIIRLSEFGDTRVTEDGNVRVASNASPNAVYGNIEAYGESFPFKAVAYIKENGVWVEFDPYVKWGGDWTLPDKVYKNISNRWKRVY